MRPNENAIVRNSFQHGAWGQEERDGHYQLRTHEMFEIAITAENNHYRVSLNNKHFANFRHRLPLHMVNFFRVSGPVTVEQIVIENNTMTIPLNQITTTQTVTPGMSMPMQMPMMQMPSQVFVTTPSAPQPPYNPAYPMNLNVDLRYDIHSANRHHGPPSYHGRHGHHGGNRHF